MHYLHEEQIVEIPFDVLKEASAGEKSTRGNRRAYAPNQPDELDRIRHRFMTDDAPSAKMRPLTSAGNSN